MQRNYAITFLVAAPLALPNRKKRKYVLLGTALAFILYVAYLFSIAGRPVVTVTDPLPMNDPQLNVPPPVSTGARVDSVATVVQKALYFKSLLSTTQQSTLQQTYTTTLARKWSNLPCGSSCRNGTQFSTLSSTQLAAALDVIRAAAGTTTDEGFSEFQQIRLADRVLQTQYNGGTRYDSTIFFISFLNTPTTTGAWMLQFGGHHYAANIAYNGGRVVGATPYFMGLEPTSFTVNSTTYAPLKAEHDSFAVMLAGLSSAQLTSAKLSSTYSDCYMIPGESNNHSYSTFPAKAGLRANVLTDAQKSLVYAAIRNYTNDLDDSTAAVLQAVFQSGIDSTYIGWTGSGTSGNSSTFLNANTNYVRLDGPRLWLEFICQNGAVIQNQIHYHTVLRDHTNDYGIDLTATTLPLNLLSFDAVAQGKSRLLTWTTSNETNVSHFEVQRTVDPSVSFTTVAKVSATNRSNSSYTYTDNAVLDANVVYYRLNTVDKDGRANLSNIVAVQYTGGTSGITLYPNPVQNVITIANPAMVSNATIRILNSTGKTILQSTNRSGRNLMVDISMLPAGSYIVQLQQGNKINTMKFVKQK
jgi:hypothetical protein